MTTSLYIRTLIIQPVPSSVCNRHGNRAEHEFSLSLTGERLHPLIRRDHDEFIKTIPARVCACIITSHNVMYCQQSFKLTWQIGGKFFRQNVIIISSPSCQVVGFWWEIRRALHHFSNCRGPSLEFLITEGH